MKRWFDRGCQWLAIGVTAILVVAVDASWIWMFVQVKTGATDPSVIMWSRGEWFFHGIGCVFLTGLMAWAVMHRRMARVHNSPSLRS